MFRTIWVSKLKLKSEKWTQLDVDFQIKAGLCFLTINCDNKLRLYMIRKMLDSYPLKILSQSLQNRLHTLKISEVR